MQIEDSDNTGISCEHRDILIQNAQMPPPARFNSTHPGFVDACAAVMLVLKEPGKELARDRPLKSFNPSGQSFY
jgi:hypothetical protein